VISFTRMPPRKASAWCMKVAVSKVNIALIWQGLWVVDLRLCLGLKKRMNWPSAGDLSFLSLSVLFHFFF
jgi:hypothetical protein